MASLIVIFGLTIHFAVSEPFICLDIGYTITSTLILKVTIAIRGMEKHIEEIV